MTTTLNPGTVITNIDPAMLFGLPTPATMRLPDGQAVSSAVQGHVESLAWWTPWGGAYHEIGAAQAFAESLWEHFAAGTAVSNFNTPALQQIGLGFALHVSDAMLVSAVMGIPPLLDHVVSLGLTEQQVIAYAHAQAPDIMIVGQSGASQ